MFTFDMNISFHLCFKTNFVMPHIQNIIPTSNSKVCFTIHLEYVFSNCGRRTTTYTPTIVYWYTALIKNRNLTWIKILKIKLNINPIYRVIHIERSSRFCMEFLKEWSEADVTCFNI
jgi:hypothetical protein